VYQKLQQELDLVKKQSEKNLAAVSTIIRITLPSEISMSEYLRCEPHTDATSRLGISEYSPSALSASPIATDSTPRSCD
jgi:hypothetical protein